jgi:N-acetylmuramoyl-L-alanine amidase
MPFLFLSPSTQDFNPYVTTGNEAYWMNLLADAMTPWLEASGVNVTRNNPSGSAVASIADSNAGSYDFHLALHSNASPESLAGKLRGVDVYYYPTSELGLRMANILVDNLQTVYPDPARVRALPTTAIGEVRRTDAPSVLAELGYHDNVDDANWLTENLDAVAEALARGVTEYFGLPFLAPTPVRQGRIHVTSGNVNLRELPETSSAILAKMPNGAAVEVLGEFNDWYTVRYNGLIGFAKRQYIATDA